MGLIWEAGVVQTQLLNQIQDLVGVEGADFVAGLLTNIGSQAENIVATIIGIITLLFGAVGVFNELHDSLNIIWDVREEESKGFLQTVKKVIIDRLLSFTMILGIGFLLLVSLVISAGLSATQETFGNAFPLSEFLLQIVNTITSIGVFTVLFTLMYKFLSDAEIAWQDVWVGSFITSVFFSLGKTAIGIYLGNSGVASSFGAEFTQVYANKYGSKIVPEGKEETAQPELKGTRDLRGRPALLASAVIAITSREKQLEKENRQTARFLLGLVITSFFTGIFTAIFGLKKR
jgi:membrane protein